MKKQILVIYTGGTIGMVKDPKTGALHPFDLGKIYEALPILCEFNFQIDSIRFNPIIDSSDMDAQTWIRLAQLIGENYDQYEGFVILHGTDTMSYTASVLSFLLEGLKKPVVLTGSQLPLGVLRTDGRDNIISALEIAATQSPIIPEVCVFFDNKLYRGNRTTKINSEHFEAFFSGNYPSLAKVGINIDFKTNLIAPPSSLPFKVYTKLDDRIAILKLFPGIRKEYMQSILSVKDLKAVVLETFGSGNTSTKPWFIETLKDAIDRGIILYNVTQCKAGSVNMGQYESSIGLSQIGVISGYDITTESAIAKLMFLLGNFQERETIETLLKRPLRGEQSQESHPTCGC